MSDRRDFLKFLASSPLLLSPAWLEAFTQAPTAQAAAATLASAADALDVYDFEVMARKVLPPAHWGYLATGVDGEETLRANPRGFDRYMLRTRRFVDVSRIDTGREIFGQTFKSPIVLCPVGSQRAFHAQGELAVARAAQARGQLQILSTQSSMAIEDVVKARGGSGLWYQLYTTNNWDVTTKLLKRAEAAGCPVVAVTVDLPGGRNTETDQRMARIDTRVCADCHGVPGPRADGRVVGTKPMFAGLDMTDMTLTSATLTWDFVKRVKEVTKMKVVIKGLESGDDAALAVTSGVVPRPQSPAALKAFAAAVAAQDDLRLTALHAMTAACGSLVIALALMAGRLDAAAAFAVSQLDETFQIQAWGEDAEATVRRRALAEDIEAAARFVQLLDAGSRAG